ncbi:hypothetical protein D1007_38755 [Hordeum vulgare]|nr:hypothetical protein D1007_38755 [Hordeum vulgare]
MVAFRDCLEACKLADLGFLGIPFTYNNGQSMDQNVEVRLDRACADEAWRDIFPRALILSANHPNGTCRFNTVSDFLDDNGAWRANHLHEFFWAMDVEYILKIRASPRLRNDFLFWSPKKSSMFTVRSAYRLAT